MVRYEFHTNFLHRLSVKIVNIILCYDSFPISKFPKSHGKIFCRNIVNMHHESNETARFKKCKQLFEYQHLLLLIDIW
jgi:hypothetical protein